MKEIRNGGCQGIQLLAVALLLLSNEKLRAAEGFVQTTDGQQLAGEIQLETDAVLVTQSNQPPTRVELPKLSVLQFRPVSPPDTSSATGLVQVLRGPATQQPPDAPSPPAPVLEPTGRVS